jgi:hypothetical protein
LSAANCAAVKPTQIIMNGQARSLEVESTGAPGEWLVKKMGTPRGTRIPNEKTHVVMEDATLRKCEVVTKDGHVILQVLR